MKKLQYTTNDPSATTDYLAADNTWKTIPGGGGGVPYTGATGNVDLGVHSLIAQGTSYNPTTPPSYLEGKVWYDSNQKSLSFYNDSSLSPVFIGENIVLKVYNNTGSTISKGAPVYIQSGGTFTYPNVALAKADAAATAAVIGLMNADTPTGNFGYVTSAGVITGVNTGGLTEGTILYLSPYSAGQLMNTVPPTGYAVQVGVVAHQNTPNGTIYTKQTTPLAISAATIVGILPVANGGTGVSSITASRALASDATGKVVASAVTATELGYVSGVTSSIQSQLDTKIGVSKTFLLGNHGGATVATGGTTYGGFVKNGLVILSQAFQVRTVMPEACTLRNWSVYVGAQPASGSLVFTMRLNLVDTAYTLTIAAGSALGVYQNTAGSLSVPAQGILEYKITNNAATSSGTIVAVSVTAEI
jgi:hypothetical protein